MTVKDLIARLSQMDSSLPVHVECPSGDHWHTKLALATEGADEMQITRSDYHGCDKLLRQDPEEDCAQPDEDERKTARTVCVIY